MTIKIEVTTELIMSLYKQLDSLFPWQKRWYAQRFQRDRYLHKGRQIGADYYFALEAVLDACLTGRNKIFIECASIDPKDKFHSNAAHYMAYFLGCSIYPDTRMFTLSNGAEICFLPENHLFWAAYSGDAYVSEWAWYANPNRIMKVVTGVTMHEKWRRTYYSSLGECYTGAEVMFPKKEYFYDVVPFQPYECSTEHCNKITGMRDSYPADLFNQLILCQLPEGARLP